MRTVVVFFACDLKFAVCLFPCSYLVGAGFIGEEFECNAVRTAYIREAASENITESIFADVGCCRRDRRQRADDLILNRIACGCRCIVLKAVGDNIGRVIFTGVLNSFTYSFFKCYDTSFVFRIKNNIVVPVVAAGRNLVARTVCHTTINRGHGQRDEARICRACHHFRRAGFNQQVETYGEARYIAVAVLISLGHCRTAVVFNVGFERVFYGCGIGLKCSFKCCTKLIRLVVPLARVKRIVGIFIAVFAVCKADSSEHICAFHSIDCIQHLDVAVGATAVLCRLRKLRDVRNFEVCVFDTFDRVTVACLSITESRRCTVRTGTCCAAKNLIYTSIILTGGNVAAFVPHAILFGICKVVLINRQLCLCVHIDGSFIDSSRRGRDQRGAGQSCC